MVKNKKMEGNVEKKGEFLSIKEQKWGSLKEE
jgi:hypothetical protein